MNPFTAQLAQERIRDMHRTAGRLRASHAARDAVARWFARAQLGPVNNYVTR
jgi:hypothetical protein